MTPRAKTPTTRLARCLQKAFTSLAASGLMGAAAQTDAAVAIERAALQARVEGMRALLHEARPAEAPSALVAQWNNFKNWNNWNNWKKWLNQ